MRKCLMTIMALLLVLPAMAQTNRVYIEDFEIEPGTTITVPLMLANDTPTRGLQCNITLPQGLAVEECVANEYALKHDMTVLSNFNEKDNCYIVFMYPPTRAIFPAGSNAVLNVVLKASSTFKGGSMAFWKCRGSDGESKIIIMDDCTVTVTVPPGVPMDTKSGGDDFFQLGTGF